MDPISTIIAYLVKDVARHAARTDLSGWYAIKGFRPTLQDLQEAADRRGQRLPRTWKAMAIRLGAIQ